MALKILQQRHCHDDYLHCPRYLRCEIINSDIVVYEDVALVRKLVESCLNGKLRWQNS
jgi:hypothetical protein